MENLILSCFLHLLPILENHKPFWALPFFPTFATSFNYSIVKKTRHIACNGHTDGQRKSLLLETSHLLWSLFIWEECRSRATFIFVTQARQRKNFVCRDGETYGRLAELGPWWGSEASLIEWAFKIIKNYNTNSGHITPSGKRPSKFKEKKTT